MTKKTLCFQNTLFCENRVFFVLWRKNMVFWKQGVSKHHVFAGHFAVAFLQVNMVFFESLISALILEFILDNSFKITFDQIMSTNSNASRISLRNSSSSSTSQGSGRNTQPFLSPTPSSTSFSSAGTSSSYFSNFQTQGTAEPMINISGMMGLFSPGASLTPSPVASLTPTPASGNQNSVSQTTFWEDPLFFEGCVRGCQIFDKMCKVSNFQKTSFSVVANRVLKDLRNKAFLPEACSRTFEKTPKFKLDKQREFFDSLSPEGLLRCKQLFREGQMRYIQHFLMLWHFLLCRTSETLSKLSSCICRKRGWWRLRLSSCASHDRRWNTRNFGTDC